MALSSSSPSPYPLQNSSQGYTFVTDYGTPYLVYFTEGEGYFPETSFAPHTFMLGFGPTTPPEKLVHDVRIAPTVAAVATLFFQDARHVLLYLCDTKDQRQALRHRLFNQWFATHAPPGYIRRVLVSPPHLYAAVVFLDTNPYAQEIQQALPGLEEKIEPSGRS